jgi:hypothetical protein
LCVQWLKVAGTAKSQVERPWYWFKNIIIFIKETVE